MSATFWRPSLKAYPPCHCSVRQCRFPAILLKILMTLSYCTASGTLNLYPTPLFLFGKHRDNTTLDRQLTRGSVLLVTAHARDVGTESPFALRKGRYVTNVWYKRHYLVPLHGVSTAALPQLKFQPSTRSL